MKADNFKQAIKIIQSLVLEKKSVDYPHLSRKQCVSALKNIFKKCNIKDIAEYIKKEAYKSCKSDLEKVLIEENAKSLFHLDNNFVSELDIKRGILCKQTEYDLQNNCSDVKSNNVIVHNLNQSTVEDTTLNNNAPNDPIVDKCTYNDILNKNLILHKDRVDNDMYPYVIDYPYYDLYGLQGHIGYASCAIFISEDVLVTAAEDKVIKIWNIQEGTLISSLVKHDHLITDICASMDNEYIVSCDISGVLIIWSLRTFEIIHVAEMNGSVELVEFTGIKQMGETEKCNSNAVDINKAPNNHDDTLDIKKYAKTQEQDPDDQYNVKKGNGNNPTLASSKDQKKHYSHTDTNIESKTSQDLDKAKCSKTKYSLVTVSDHGSIQLIHFDSETLINQSENNIMTSLGDDETVRAICVSEGGRFLLTGGFWPFILVFDTQNLVDNVFTFETDGHSVVSICGSKNRTKFAASTNTNLVYEFEFFERNMNIAAKQIVYKQKDKPGVWTKKIMHLCDQENVYCERIAYLCNNTLVCICSDATIKILDNKITSLSVTDTEIMCCHPKIPLLCISGFFDSENDFVAGCNEMYQDDCEQRMNTKPSHRFIDLNNIEASNFMPNVQIPREELINTLLNKKKAEKIIYNRHKPKTVNNSPGRHFLRIYRDDFTLISSFPIHYKLSDASFCPTGKYLTTLDETGQIRVYSVFYSDAYKAVVREQFTKQELMQMHGHEIENERSAGNDGNKILDPYNYLLQNRYIHTRSVDVCDSVTSAETSGPHVKTGCNTINTQVEDRQAEDAHDDKTSAKKPSNHIKCDAYLVNNHDEDIYGDKSNVVIGCGYNKSDSTTMNTQSTVKLQGNSNVEFVHVEKTYTLANIQNTIKPTKTDLFRYINKKLQNCEIYSYLENLAMGSIKDKFYTHTKFSEKYIVKENNTWVREEATQVDEVSLMTSEDSSVESISSAESTVSESSKIEVKRRKAAIMASNQIKRAVQGINESIFEDVEYERKKRIKTVDSSSSSLHNERIGNAKKSDTSSKTKKKSAEDLIVDFLRTPNKKFDIHQRRQASLAVFSRKSLVESSSDESDLPKYTNRSNHFEKSEEESDNGDSCDSDSTTSSIDAFKRKRSQTKQKQAWAVKFPNRRSKVQQEMQKIVDNESSEKAEYGVKFPEKRNKAQQKKHKIIDSESIDNVDSAAKFPNRRSKAQSKSYDKKSPHEFNLSVKFPNRRGKAQQEKQKTNDGKTCNESDHSTVKFPQRRRISYTRLSEQENSSDIVKIESKTNLHAQRNGTNSNRSKSKSKNTSSSDSDYAKFPKRRKSFTSKRKIIIESEESEANTIKFPPRRRSKD